MDLSHQSITGRQFELNRRGYDPDAVDAHLSEIAAAVDTQARRIAEMETTIVALEAKVQDADESEEALRLTLKAAAHAKEELLAGAREQVRVTEAEADEKAAALVATAEANARALTDEAGIRAQAVTGEAEARAAALNEGATAQARDVAQAALAESELLVGRIEQLRAQLEVVEESLRALSVETDPQLENARSALEAALDQARASVENPDLLAAAARGPAPAEAVPAPFDPAPEAPAFDPAPEAPAFDPAPESLEPAVAAAAPEASDVYRPAEPEPDDLGPSESLETADQPHVEEMSSVAEEVAEPAPDEHSGEDAPHLEVVEPTLEATESTADISDKVDRLLEELREVT